MPVAGDRPPPPSDGGGDGGSEPPSLDLGNLVIPGLGGGGDGGGSSGGAAPVDPTVTAAESFYFQLWGRKAPEGYVKNFLNGTTDLFDFISFQLSRPGARKTRFYANEVAGYAAQAARIMGRR